MHGIQNKWLTDSGLPASDQTQYSIWHKFVRTAAERLDAGNYQEIPTKLWDEDFQIPPIESINRDKSSYSREMDTRQEIEYQTLHQSGETEEKAKPTPAEIREQLGAWTIRNLTIFLIEYVVDSEIRIQNIAEQTGASISETLDKRIKKIEAAYQHILQTLNAVDYYASEPQIYDPYFNTHPHKFDIKNEVEKFSQQLNLVSILITAPQFELLKLKLSYNTANLELPNDNELIRIGALRKEQCLQEIADIEAARQAQPAVDAAPENNNLRSSLRRSQRVHSELCHKQGSMADLEAAAAVAAATPDAPAAAVVAAAPAAAAPAPVPPAVQINMIDIRKNYENNKRWNTTKQAVIGLAVGLGVAALIAAAVTITVLTGGTAFLAFTVGAVTALATLAAIGACITCYTKAKQKAAERRFQEQEQHYLAARGISITRNASLHRTIRQPGVTQSQSDSENVNVPADNTSAAAVTSPQLSASQPVQSQETTTAATLSAILR